MKFRFPGECFTSYKTSFMGLVSETLDDTNVMTRAVAIATQLVALPVLSLRFIKKGMPESMNLPIDQRLQFERQLFQRLFSTADKDEGMRVQLEKQRPVFL